jgi:hypothetical protein
VALKLDLSAVRLKYDIQIARHYIGWLQIHHLT